MCNVTCIRKKTKYKAEEKEIGNTPNDDITFTGYFEFVLAKLY